MHMEVKLNSVKGTVIKKERESGYYWFQLRDPFTKEVFTDDPVTEEGWEVGYYDKGKGWISMWDGGYYKEEDVEDVIEIRLLPKKS